MSTSTWGTPSSSWSDTGIHQHLKSSGSYNANSSLAKEYAGLEEDGGSRVDDEEGWREIHRDKRPKSAKEYRSMVQRYAAEGFDVKAIDMDGDDFTHANFAIKPMGEKDNGPAKPKEPYALSPEMAHAKAQVAQWDEDILSGRFATDLYDPDYNHKAAATFLDRYKVKLGKQLENGSL